MSMPDYYEEDPDVNTAPEDDIEDDDEESSEDTGEDDE